MSNQQSNSNQTEIKQQSNSNQTAVSMIFHNSFRGEDLSEWMIGCDKVESSETVSTPKVLSGVKNKDIYVVLAEIFGEHGIKNRDSLKEICAKNSDSRSKCDAIYKMVYDRLPGVLTMHRNGEAGAIHRIRCAYQAMLPGYSIYNAKKFPVAPEPVVESVVEPVVGATIHSSDEYESADSDDECDDSDDEACMYTWEYKSVTYLVDNDDELECVVIDFSTQEIIGRRVKNSNGKWEIVGV